MEKKSIVLIHGCFEDEFFDGLKKRGLKEVFVCEGRPSLKSSKDAVKALQKRKITPTVITDNMAGFLFYKGYVKEVNIASQVTDKNGVLAQIGSLVLSVLAKAHKVPVNSFKARGKLKLLDKPQALHKFNGRKVVDGATKTFVPLVEWVDREYLKAVN